MTVATPHDLIFISVGLLFIYCVAAIAAPAVASVLMKDFGPQIAFHPERLRAPGDRGGSPSGALLAEPRTQNARRVAPVNLSP